MPEPVLLAIIAMISAVVGASIAQVAAMLRAPSQARLDDANAEKAQHESAALVNTQLRTEIDRLSAKVTALEIRVVESERRATLAETRLADAENRANEFRRAVIVLGEKLNQERIENRSTTEKLCILIEHLLDCAESPDKANQIDQKGIRAIINNVRRWCG